MGLVFAARHLALDERVAIKVLAPAATDDQGALARLQREARILARVRNEHVVRVIDLGQLEDGAPFMVMEHLTGRDLGSLLEEQGRLGVELAVSYVLQALVALAAAHANGVVHRDLKPENLFYTQVQDGAWLIKVLDFGISRLERPSQSKESTMVTGPSAVMGTPLYMSPEQLRDTGAVDARSDIWSIGVVLYELVTGVAPFTGASFADIAVKIATEPPPALASIDPSLAPGLESVLARCLQKERDDRFASVAELARALEPFGPVGCKQLVERVERLVTDPSIRLSSDPNGLRGVDPLSAPAPGRSTSASPATSPAAMPAAWRPSRVQLLLALSALLTLLVAWRLIESHSGPSTVAPAEAGLLEQPPPAAVTVVAPHVSTTALDPEVPRPADDSRAPPQPTGDLAKTPPVALSVRSVSASNPLCNPPYTIDPQGRKKFRHECFTERTTR
jgi:serine/threonine-protein kinase